MDIFDVLSLVGGLCLFLFGMNIMGSALERRAGASLRTLLRKLTGNKLVGFLTSLERTSDHCSNIAGCVVDVAMGNMNIHQSLHSARTEDPQFAWRFGDYAAKYALPKSAE